MVRQPAVDMRLVSVMQHIHHMRATDALGVGKAGILIAARLQIRDAAFRALLHVLLSAKHDSLGRTGLGASWSLPHRQAIRAQGAFMRDVILAGDAGNVEWATLHTI